eukprot:TRINITY_DN8198_c0_g1_i2.p1 TRINITY_DN8198_c0_g1~~TRINITY_DN8198_c0_g1_i2.p1  ORF type:complete len:105 (-),score=6.56 TRINITY_DN8198_c0_g1_i2:8-322(-)
MPPLEGPLPSTHLEPPRGKSKGGPVTPSAVRLVRLLPSLSSFLWPPTRALQPSQIPASTMVFTDANPEELKWTKQHKETSLDLLSFRRTRVLHDPLHSTLLAIP